MNYYPHHHPSCFCWVCRNDKPGHPADRCHCERCLVEADTNWTPEHVRVDQWESVQPHIQTLRDAGYYVSPVGEIEGDVYVEVEEDAVELWRELTA